MAPINIDQLLVKEIEKFITSNKVMIFSKSPCPFCAKVKDLFTDMNEKFTVLEFDKDPRGSQLHEALKEHIKKNTVPQVFVNGTHIGGCDDTLKAHAEGRLSKLLHPHPYEYDLIVIGGGSGGLAASKEATSFGRKVALVDFVKPTPLGTTWGLGGTCVNVGCIPKKLMHQAAIVGHSFKDAHAFGWKKPEEQIKLHENIVHDWLQLREAVQNSVKGQNFSYRVALRKNNVEYINAYAEFVNPHTVKLTYKDNTEKEITADKFIIATGERPRYPDIPGAREYGITSDDLFSLPYPPGKTLVVGASYVALECAGFLRGLGFDVTILVRSILLRGFDQEVAEKIYEYMTEEEGIKFHRPCIPESVELIEEGKPGKLRVTAVMLETGEKIVDEYNTVIFAIGRDPCTNQIGLDNVGVKRTKSGKIPVINEQTNVENIYAVGDILDGKLELTPVAIDAGVLLARRLFGGSDVQCDYVNVPTTVFTPIEYGACGYSEEAAAEKFGADNLEVYIQYFTALEWTIPQRTRNKCFAKLICVKNENERVVGFHYLGPNAGEVTQFSGLLLKKNCTKADFDGLIGIHPTCAEMFTTLRVTKRSGESALQQGCCG